MHPRFKTATVAAIAVAATIAITSYAGAGPEKIEFPEGYQASFVRYVTVDRPDRDPAIIRFMYVNPQALAAAQPGEPLPDGTVIIMEDHLAALGDDGAPLLDVNGHFVPTSEITNVFIQEKQPGWGTEYADDVRNGEWEYAWFQPNGDRKVGDNIRFDGCFACHKENAEGQDFNFTLSPFIDDIKG